MIIGISGIQLLQQLRRMTVDLSKMKKLLILETVKLLRFVYRLLDLL